jgi:hypothetical protein
MREAEKVEGRGPGPRPNRRRQGLSPELDEARFLRMEGQPLLRGSFLLFPYHSSVRNLAP